MPKTFKLSPDTPCSGDAGRNRSVRWSLADNHVNNNLSGNRDAGDHILNRKNTWVFRRETNLEGPSGLRYRSDYSALVPVNFFFIHRSVFIVWLLFNF